MHVSLNYRAITQQLRMSRTLEILIVFTFRSATWSTKSIWEGVMWHADDSHFNLFAHSATLTHDDVIKWKHFPRYWACELPAQRPVTQGFDVFFDLRPNKRLSKQSWGWWFETPSRSSWRHCNARKKTAFLDALPSSHHAMAQHYIKDLICSCALSCWCKSKHAILT